MSSALREPRAECTRCQRPLAVCYCEHVAPQQTRTRVLVLSHPREVDNPVGTARIAKLCLPEAELAVGVELADHPAVRRVLADRGHPAVVLYPSAKARDLARDPPSGPVTLIVIDGTWSHARSLVRNNPWLADLPHYAFQPEKPSEYRIRREPHAHCVSTIEALAEALSRLEDDGRDFEALRAPFRAMVAMQVAHAERSTGPRRRAQRRIHTSVSSRIPAALMEPELVCFAGEANAFPHDRALGRPPFAPELVQLVLCRVASHSGALLAQRELFARPRAPLAASPITHARLSSERLLAAPAFAELSARASEFIGHAPVCTWGAYAFGLYRRDGGAWPDVVVDLRKVVGDVMQSRPGSLEQTIARLALPHEPVAEGRGGERSGMLLAVARFLAERAHGQVARADGADEPEQIPTDSSRSVL